jgi:AraC-like DNA-binding protein
MTQTTAFWRDAVMPYVESRRACDSRACYRSHSHPTFSVGAVDAGQSCFTGAGAKASIIHAGTVVFVPPDHVHACNPLPHHAWSYQMLHLDATWVRQIHDEASACAVSGVMMDQVMISRDAEVYRRFCQLNDVLFSDSHVHVKEAELIAFVGDCTGEALAPLTSHVTPDANNDEAQQQLANVFAYLDTQDTNMTSLSVLAEIAGLSRYQLIRLFRKVTGMTPHAYQLNRRVNQARAQLRGGAAMADIAYQLGFADQSHFLRVFKAHAGVTPGAYRT